MPSDPADELHESSQAVLIQYLSTILELGFTLLATSNIDHDQADHRQVARNHAAQAVDSARHLVKYVEESETRTGIQEEANRLEAAIRKASG